MSVSTRVYLRLRSKVTVTFRQALYLKDIAQIIAPEHLEQSLSHTLIHRMSVDDGNYIVIDAMNILRILQTQFPELDVRFIGDGETLVEMKAGKGGTGSVAAMALVWLILFFGSGLAIMNFHTDVSMAKVHQRLYFLLTGEQNPYPLLLQIPYSIGIGVGMIVFFNRIFRKRLNEEPSPLEVEVFLYQENLEKYAKTFENRGNRRGDHGAR